MELCAAAMDLPSSSEKAVPSCALCFRLLHKPNERRVLHSPSTSNVWRVMRQLTEDIFSGNVDKKISYRGLFVHGSVRLHGGDFSETERIFEHKREGSARQGSWSGRKKKTVIDFNWSHRRFVLYTLTRRGSQDYI